MVDGEARGGEARGGEAGSARPLRSAAPEWAGPLGSSGAAPPEETAPAAKVDEPASERKAPAPEQREPQAGTPTTPEPPRGSEPSSATEKPAASASQVDESRPAPAAREPESGPGPATEIGPAAVTEAHPRSEWAPPRPGDDPAAAVTAVTPAAPAAAAPAQATGAAGVGAAATRVDVLEKTAGPRRRVRFAHALRRTPRASDVARSVRDWSGRPSGRLTLPAVLLLVLVLVGVGAGAVAIPMTAGSRTAAPDPTVSGGAAPAPTLSDGLPSGPPISGGATPLPGATPTTGPPVGLRPADVLASWASLTGQKLDVPWVAMQAYGYTELVLAKTKPTCNLKWTTLAAIGNVETNHGRYNATLGDNGQSSPRIVGPVLDGTNGNQRILDTDDGVLDGDTTYDRAVGPMQFIPTTWRQHEVDADNDGVKDINDIDDAAMAAGNYLCQGGRDLNVATDWWNAILSYNDVQRYAQRVFETANDYGARSRT
ncbi:lytic transglycosylase domain-containing protein [Phytohabitans kaempferiae]|uniref:Lytic murein transglycosylase n=1 Tax=Phytohabitans kaempferiae TaxID=1620943 RepID=A0ABV6M0T9_9ACTN